MKNPYLKNGLWYWYDEAYNEYGPYSSEIAAKLMLDKYITEELNRRK